MSLLSDAHSAHAAFSTLLGAGRYESAFRLGERMLDRFGRMPEPQNMVWPWWRKLPRSVAGPAFAVLELRRLQRAANAGGLPHWFAYCRSILLTQLGRRPAALAEYSFIKSRQTPRYLFMRQPFVVLKLDLEAHALPWVVNACRGMLRHAPGMWELRCRLAEAHLAQGDNGLAHAHFTQAARSAQGAQQRAARAWHGEAFLWLGQYQRAVNLFNEVIAQGPTAYAHAWRGAAYMKLERWDAAHRDLETARLLDAHDPETPLWRGELYRLTGRLPEALHELQGPVRSGFHWGLYNRALVKYALGDQAGLASDFDKLPGIETAWLRRWLGLPAVGSLTSDNLRRVLETGLAEAKGVRRSEAFLRRLWMR